MRVLVIGTVQFTLEMVKIIHQQEIDLVGIVTGIESGENSDYVDLAPFCDQHAIPCNKIKNINSDNDISNTSKDCQENKENIGVKKKLF